MKVWICRYYIDDEPECQVVLGKTEEIAKSRALEHLRWYFEGAIFDANDEEINDYDWDFFKIEGLVHAVETVELPVFTC